MAEQAQANAIYCFGHNFGPWFWTTMQMPAAQPMAMTGWWRKCTCCPEASKAYEFDAEATELNAADAIAAQRRSEELAAELWRADTEITDMVAQSGRACELRFCVRA